jgi:hypothetical protein
MEPVTLRRASRVVLRCAGWLLLLPGTACSSPAKPSSGTCVEGLRTDCSPLYDPPTYSTIFEKILHPTCAQGMGTCHTADAAMGGLVFEDEDDAYARLLGDAGGKARVAPGDPACSLLVERLEAKTSDVRMPPGPTPLSEAARCDIVQWISQGAAR